MIPPLPRTLRLAFLSTAFFVYFSVLLVTLALNRASWYQMTDGYAVAERVRVVADVPAARTTTQFRPLMFPQNKTVVRSARAPAAGSVLGIMNEPPLDGTFGAVSAAVPCGCGSSYSVGLKPTFGVEGRILLQVEEQGEAWYADPASSQVLYLADGGSAFQVFARQAVGITNADISRIPIGNLDRPGEEIAAVKDQLAERLRGRVLLQTESLGELWYVNPADGRRYYLADGRGAYQIMRRLGLGITNEGLEKLRGSPVLGG